MAESSSSTPSPSQTTTPTSSPSTSQTTPSIPKPEWFDEDYPELKGNVGRAAVNGQVIPYPKIVRTNSDDPLPNQVFGLLTFVVFKDPHTTSSGQKVLGLAKLRGNYVDEESCKRQAGKIVREQDSKNVIRVAPVGQWVPITEDTSFVQDQIDITEEGERSLRGEEFKKRQKEQERMMREIEERKKQCIEEDLYDDKKACKYYSMRRVTHLTLIEHQQSLEKRLAENSQKISTVLKELKGLDAEFPEYDGQWVEVYNVERRKAGIHDFTVTEKEIEWYNQETYASTSSPSTSSTSSTSSPSTSSTSSTSSSSSSSSSSSTSSSSSSDSSLTSSSSSS